MNELATITNLCDRVRRTNDETIRVSPSALRVAIEHCHAEILIANLAEEWVIENSWREQESRLQTALGASGLQKLLRTD